MLHITLTERALSWFDSKNISFHRDPSVRYRLKPGHQLFYSDAVQAEPYIGIHAGNNLCSMGTMSYSNSNLPVDTVVGRYCSLASGLRFPHYRHPIEHISTSIFTHERSTDLVGRFVRDHAETYRNFYPNAQKPAVTIENDVWVGEGAVLMPGITIGTGSVVAAHSVVTKSVPPFAIVGGNPARLIRMRFEAELVMAMLESSWWSYKFTDFAGFDLSNPKKFLAAFDCKRPHLEVYKPIKLDMTEIIGFRGSEPSGTTP